ncbi:hypothetical protein [Cyanobacterium sp. Dongsha4]|uniref:hypothetical protein n=1 Tax=Cyanobacterium sp. DS4 TaxID=2878255 RepID=UPI002E81C15D|nr:hypothetical protein [Cyanobacterium sp. Dongsha4]WVL00163.1 hypothetical protein Dongsha4_16135 [Cyanobacterium sp. Dongsha4]
MNNYEEMKELIKENKLQEALLLAFSNNLKLKITTKSKGKKEDVIETLINLLGRISNKVSDPDLINNSTLDNSDTINIVDFHERQRQLAYETWHKNRETLIGILQIISGNSATINKFKKSENNVISIKGKTDQKETDFQDFGFAQEELDNHQPQEEEENWVDNIVDSIVGGEEDEISHTEDLEQDWGDFISEDEEKESAEVIINSEEENWDEFIDNDYSEDSIANTNGANIDNSSDGGEWQEWLEEDSMSSENEEVINNAVTDNSSNLEVGEEWQEWLENEDNSDNEIIANDEMEEIDWNDEDWQEEKIN